MQDWLRLVSLQYAAGAVLLLVLAWLIPVLTTKVIHVRKTNHHLKVLLLGPINAGKTCLFSTLLFGHAAASRTSMAENKAWIKHRWTESKKRELIKKPFLLIDIPGHPRLRARALAQHLGSSTRAVLVIDGASGLSAKSVKEAADHLGLLLSLLSLLKSPEPPSVLILLTKADLLPKSPADSAHAYVERVKVTLGREMERRRLTATLANATAHKLEGLTSVTVSTSSASPTLPTDETEILRIDHFGTEPWQWDSQPVSFDWLFGSASSSSLSQSFHDWAQK